MAPPLRNLKMLDLSRQLPGRDGAIAELRRQRVI